MSGYDLKNSKDELVKGLEELTRGLYGDSSNEIQKFNAETEKSYLIKLLDIKSQEEMLIEQRAFNKKMLRWQIRLVIGTWALVIATIFIVLTQ